MSDPKAKIEIYILWYWIISFTSTVVNALVAVWNTFKVLYDALKSVWDAVKDFARPLWDLIKPLYDWVKDEIWPYVKTLLDWAGKFEKFVNDAINTLTLGLWDIWKNTIGELTKVWNQFQKVADDIIRFVAIFDQKLADQLADYVRRIRKASIGRVELINKFVNDKFDWVRKNVLARTKTLRTVLRKTTLAHRQALRLHEDFFGASYEQKQILKDQTIRLTTRQYGQTMWSEMFRHRYVEQSEPLTNWLEEQKTAYDLDQLIEILGDYDKGDWYDVANNIDTAMDCIDKGEEIPDLGLDLDKLDPDERANIEGNWQSLTDYVDHVDPKEKQDEEEEKKRAEEKAKEWQAEDEEWAKEDIKWDEEEALNEDYYRQFIISKDIEFEGKIIAPDYEE